MAAEEKKQTGWVILAKKLAGHFYWCPDRQGYTSRLSGAGRYSLTEAEEICHHASGPHVQSDRRMIHESEAPCWLNPEALIQILEKDLETANGKILEMQRQRDAAVRARVRLTKLVHQYKNEGKDI